MHLALPAALTHSHRTRTPRTPHTLPSLTRWQADAKALVRSSSWRLRLLGRISRDGDRRDRNQLGRDRNQLLMTSAMLERQLERLGAPQRLLLTAYYLLLTAYYLLLTTYCLLLTTQVRCSGCCSLGRRRCRHRPSSAAAVAAAGRAGWAGRTGQGSQRG